MEYESIATRQDGPVGVIELARPERLNSMDPATMGAELVDALRRLTWDRSIGAVVLTGRGPSFCAGAMLGERPRPIHPEDVDTTEEERLLYGYSYGQMWAHMRSFGKPLLAAVNGYALGGGWELALHCDMVVAGESAIFGCDEIRVGQIPYAGNVKLLTAILGKFLAFQLVTSGRRITAQEALNLRLVNAVVPDAECLTHAIQLAHQLLAGSAVAIGLTKKLIARVVDIEQDYDLERAYAHFIRGTATFQDSFERRTRDIVGGNDTGRHLNPAQPARDS
jgi:enoyl-CoA hydratase